MGHLETDFLAESDSEADARAVVGALSLAQVRGALHALIAERQGGPPPRRWWDAMRDDSDPEQGGAGS
jgi:soluble lytic murein transglycosylase-like protein